MDIQVKAIVDADPDLRTITHPDWAIFEIGKFATPLCIISETTMSKIVEEYCKYHNIKTTTV